MTANCITFKDCLSGLQSFLTENCTHIKYESIEAIQVVRRRLKNSDAYEKLYGVYSDLFAIETVEWESEYRKPVALKIMYQTGMYLLREFCFAPLLAPYLPAWLPILVFAAINHFLAHCIVEPLLIYIKMHYQNIEEQKTFTAQLKDSFKTTLVGPLWSFGYDLLPFMAFSNTLLHSMVLNIFRKFFSLYVYNEGTELRENLVNSPNHAIAGAWKGIISGIVKLWFQDSIRPQEIYFLHTIIRVFFEPFLKWLDVWGLVDSSYHHRHQAKNESTHEISEQSTSDPLEGS